MLSEQSGSMRVLLEDASEYAVKSVASKKPMSGNSSRPGTMEAGMAIGADVSSRQGGSCDIMPHYQSVLQKMGT